MSPSVSIIMGSTSDLPVLRKAADFLEQMEVPFEMLALSAHRTPAEVENFASSAKSRGVKVIIAAAGMAAALPGVIAALTHLPVQIVVLPAVFSIAFFTAIRIQPDKFNVFPPISMVII